MSYCQGQEEGFTSGQRDRMHCWMQRYPRNELKMNADEVLQDDEVGLSENNILIDIRDGKSYEIVTIGSQVWMAENLNYMTENAACYNDVTSYCIAYGRLYPFEEMSEACPEGWHIPTPKEWVHLWNYLGGPFIAGGKMKSIQSNLSEEGAWNAPNTGATNETGFNGLPGGHQYTFPNGDEGYMRIGEDGIWWVDDATNRTRGGALSHKSSSIAVWGFSSGTVKLSIRCVKD